MKKKIIIKKLKSIRIRIVCHQVLYDLLLHLIQIQMTLNHQNLLEHHQLHLKINKKRKKIKIKKKVNIKKTNQKEEVVARVKIRINTKKNINILHHLNHLQAHDNLFFKL